MTATRATAMCNPLRCVSARLRGRARGHQRGAVMVEYAFLLFAVGIPIAAGCIAGGAAMVSQYNEARDAIFAPYP
jgi:hypothetical protein